MKVKEHIKSLKELIVCKGYTLEISQETVETIKELISLLEQGKAYRQMWGEFDNEYGHLSIIVCGMNRRICDWMKDIKQKYLKENNVQES